MLLFSCPELPQVEFKFLAFENISIGTTRLAGSAGNYSVETAGGELRFKEGVNLGIFLPLVQVTLRVI